MIDLIPDGYTMRSVIKPDADARPLTIFYRPATQIEWNAHLIERQSKETPEAKDWCRLEWLAKYIKSWDAKGYPPITAESLNRVHNAYFQSIENLITGFAVDPRAMDADEKKS